MQKIKICGIRRAADIEIVNKYRPDYIDYKILEYFIKNPKDTYLKPMQWN